MLEALFQPDTRGRSEVRTFVSASRWGPSSTWKVIDLDPRRGEPKLSIRALKEDEERRAHRDYRKELQKQGGFGTLGDLLAKKLGTGAGGNKD